MKVDLRYAALLIIVSLLFLSCAEPQAAPVASEIATPDAGCRLNRETNP